MLPLQINALDDSAASISGLCSLTGSEYSRLAPTEQASAVARLSVFARVEPSHKSNLVTRLKEQVRLASSEAAALSPMPWALPKVLKQSWTTASPRS